VYAVFKACHEMVFLMQLTTHSVNEDSCTGKGGEGAKQKNKPPVVGDASFTH